MPGIPFMRFGSARDIEIFIQHTFGVSDHDSRRLQVWNAFTCLENTDHSWEVFFAKRRVGYAETVAIAGKYLSERDAAEWMGKKLIGAFRGRNACYRGHAGNDFPDLFKPIHTTNH